MTGDGRFERIDIYVDERQYESALEELKKILEEEPDNAEVYERLGNVYNLMGDTDLAMEMFSKAVELNPRMEDA
ncbi:MAG: tetratricopeptide repeat protein, partial [Candidatus Omnitrophica bacterium]|nr:tetratricopeptide repeat protein [Candidatus Omnitrophota bacterium]